jgi:hypothetical protein
MLLQKLSRLIDVKSIVTLSIIFTMVFVVISGRTIDEKTFLLFSNVATMIVTYFFTKKKEGE